MTLEDLKGRTRKELAAMARRDRVAGWHSMRKHELIQALFTRHRRQPGTNGGRSVSGNGRSRMAASPSSKSNSSRRSAAKSAATNGSQKNSRKIMTHAAGADAPAGMPPDRLVADLCDPHWIHVRWFLSRTVIARARAALGVEWHQAVPVIRVFDVTQTDMTNAIKTWVRDVEIHSDIDHWYIPVDRFSRCYRFEIGFRTPSSRFFALAQSNHLMLPDPGTTGTIEHECASGPESLPEESGSARAAASSEKNGASIHQLNGLLMKKPAAASDANAGGLPPRKRRADPLRKFEFEVEAELVIRGSTHPNAELTLLGQPVPLDSDGNFSLRFRLPNGRQVIPATAVTPNGAEQRTIILAVERNTKELAPQPLEDPLL